MDKIILNNNTNLEIDSIVNTTNGMVITFKEKTINDLESEMTKDNLSKLQVANSNGEVYGIYNNLICNSITKNLIDSSITVNLSKLDDTQVKIAELQQTIDTLVLANLGV